MPITCLVFDCDGIIFESVDIKSKAFAALAAPYGQEAQERFALYNALNGGVSRVIKFQWFFNEILDKEISPEELKQWSNRFVELCVQEIKNCPLVPGIEDTLNKWYNKLPMYVCSGAPQDELEFLLQQRNLAHYFVSIHGYPPRKDILLRNIAISSKCINDEILMIGDSSTDMYAAEEVGTQFYGRGVEFKSDGCPWDYDLRNLNAWIEKNIQ